MKSLSIADAPAGLAAIDTKRTQDWYKGRPRQAWREPFSSAAEPERRVSNRARVAGKAFTSSYPEYGRSVEALPVEPAKLDYVLAGSYNRRPVAFRSSRLVLTRSGECRECSRYARVRWYKLLGPSWGNLRAWHNLGNERVRVPRSLLTSKDDPRSALCTSCAHAVWEDNSSTRRNRTEKREEQAFDLWARGVPDERIALEVGRSVNTVRRFEEIELGKLAVREIRAMLARYLRNTGIGVPEISRRLGVTPSHVRNLLKVDPWTARTARVVLGVFAAVTGSPDAGEMLRRLAADEQKTLAQLEAWVRTGSWIQPPAPLPVAVREAGETKILAA